MARVCVGSLRFCLFLYPFLHPPHTIPHTQPPIDDYWDEGADGYYDDYAAGGVGGGAYDEPMLTGVSPTGQLEPIGDEILVRFCVCALCVFCVWYLARRGFGSGCNAN